MPLKRTLSLWLLTFYGLGTIIGAGVYALLGEVIEKAHEFTPFAFLLSSIIALFTAASYAELSARFPKSAGSALYVRRAFNNKWLSGLVGWMIVFTGVVSAATISHGFLRYLQLLMPAPFYPTLFLLITVLGLIAIWGITESARTIMLMTLIEVTGLLMVVYYGKESFVHVTTIDYPALLKADTWQAIFAGAFIAFYAFIGFEDMVNVAEETKNPTRVIPLAILLALLGATILYLLVAFVTVFSLSATQLLQSKVPLAYIIQAQGHSPLLFTLIGIIAIMNGILVQIIMASRLIYGMAAQQNAPKLFMTVYTKTQTPVYSSLLVMIAILMFAYWLPIDTLAKTTTTTMLLLFSIMHLSLITVKLRDQRTKPAFYVPLFFPMIGLVTTLGFLIAQWVL